MTEEIKNEEVKNEEVKNEEVKNEENKDEGKKSLREIFREKFLNKWKDSDGKLENVEEKTEPEKTEPEKTEPEKTEPEIKYPAGLSDEEKKFYTKLDAAGRNEFNQIFSRLHHRLAKTEENIRNKYKDYESIHNNMPDEVSKALSENKISVSDYVSQLVYADENLRSNPKEYIAKYLISNKIEPQDIYEEMKKILSNVDAYIAADKTRAENVYLKNNQRISREENLEMKARNLQSVLNDVVFSKNDDGTEKYPYAERVLDYFPEMIPAGFELNEENIAEVFDEIYKKVVWLDDDIRKNILDNTVKLEVDKNLKTKKNEKILRSVSSSNLSGIPSPTKSVGLNSEEIYNQKRSEILKKLESDFPNFF